MTRPNLSSTRAKMDRAWEHIEALHEVGQGFLNKQTHRFEHEYKPYLRAYSIWIIPLEEPPPELNIILGDVLYNCGSALDHLVCALTRLTNPADECDKTQFPIFVTTERYRDREATYLRGVPPKAKAIIKRLQPYMAKLDGGTAETQILEVFRMLYNTDKHRRLNVALSAVQDAFFRPNQPGITPVGDIFAGTFKDRTKLVQFAVPWSVTGKVRVDCDVTVTVGLDEGKGRWPDNLGPSLSDGIQSIYFWITEEILPKFERDLGPLP